MTTAKQDIDRLADALTASGELTDQEWRRSMHAVPRHLFIPERGYAMPNSYRQGPPAHTIDRTADPDGWWAAVYSNMAVITQRDNGAGDPASANVFGSTTQWPGADPRGAGEIMFSMARTLITVAPTGAEAEKAKVAALPVTLDELVRTAKDCAAAGAAVIHVHIRDADARPTLDLSRLRDTVTALRESTDLIVQLSTGGAVTDPYEDRLRVLLAEPDACSLTCGTVNFGEDVFMNPWPFMAELYRRTQEAEVVPEFELFDLGHVAALHRLLDKYGPPYGGHVHCDLVMGVPGGMAGDARTLVAAVEALPEGATWSATGIGRTTLPVMYAALSAGGHLRVGLEDTLTYAKGEPVRANAQLVERAATLARTAQREPMPPDEARSFLGVKSR